MSTILVPYNQAMRLGQGYNTYLQQICMDRAVTFGDGAIQMRVASSTGDVSTVPASEDLSFVQEETPSTAPGDKPQIVTYRTAFADKLSDIVENLNISAAASIRTGTLRASGSAAYVNENKFKESNINFMVNVQVMNDKTELDQELLKFNAINSVVNSPEMFTKHYGDGFISGFIEGGEMNAIVSIKVVDEADLMAVKASLQVASAMISAEGSADYKSSLIRSTAHKTTETNITINWSGGGQIKDPEVEWSIPNLLEAAAAFPNQVAKCPQKTWAIITKYQYLRSYVETVSNHTFIEYELAASYTSVLLDNFIEYKLMMKQVAMIMENIADYEQSSTCNAYPVDVVSLAKARFDIQREMARIVVRVNEINVDPQKALGMVQGPLPPNISAITDSHFYSVRLPVKRSLKALPPPEVSTAPVSKATPRVKAEKIHLDTTEIRSWKTPAANDSKVFNFTSPRPQPPQFATGINKIDMMTATPVRLDIDISDVSTTQYRVNLNSWDDTVKYTAGASWFEVAGNDPDFQVGRVHTAIPNPYSFPDNKYVTTKVKFPRVFSDDVEVLVWLTALASHCGKAGYLKIGTSLSNFKRESFELSYGTSGPDNSVNELAYSWIAYPKNKEGVESGWLNKVKVTHADAAVTNEVKFTKSFKKPPSVWIALSGMDLTNTSDENVRLLVKVLPESITTTGFKYEMALWWRTKAKSASAYWLALEMD